MAPYVPPTISSRSEKDSDCRKGCRCTCSGDYVAIATSENVKDCPECTQYKANTPTNKFFFYALCNCVQQVSSTSSSIEHRSEL